MRNVDRKPNAFWLQTSGNRFFPDFMAMLVDGRILADEYKGKVWVELQKEQEKRIIGDLWAEASGGACVFCMPVANDFGAIDRAIEPPS